MIEDIAKYLYNNLQLKQPIQVYDYQDKNLSDIHIQNYEDMEKVGDWLYKDATIYLVRKNNIYNLFKEHYNQIKNKEIPS